MKWIQKCLICKYKAELESDDKNAENIIRATCLPCGHQGMFTLERIKEKIK